MGEWRDTFPTFDGELTTRFRASDLPGEVVMHCHFLRHEDTGMMVRETRPPPGSLIYQANGSNAKPMAPERKREGERDRERAREG